MPPAMALCFCSYSKYYGGHPASSISNLYNAPANPQSPVNIKLNLNQIISIVKGKFIFCRLKHMIVPYLVKMSKV